MKTENKLTHTPKTWIKTVMNKSTRTPKEVAYFAGVNEGYVLRAIYAHDDLLEAAKTALNTLEKIADTEPTNGNICGTDAILSLREAIAKAEGSNDNEVGA